MAHMKQVALLMLSGLFYPIVMGLTALSYSITLVKRMEGHSGSWSPGSASRFLLDDSDHSKDHSENKKEEAYHHWKSLIDVDPTKQPDAAVAKQERHIHPERHTEPKRHTERKHDSEQSGSTSLEQIQKKSKRQFRVTERQRLFNKFVKEGSDHTEALEKASKIISQRQKDSYNRNPAIQERRRLREIKQREKKDARNATRRENYAIRTAAARAAGGLTRKRKPPGQGIYDMMYKTQVEKRFRQGASKEDAEKAAKAYMEEKHTKNIENSRKFNEKKRKLKEESKKEESKMPKSDR